MGRQAKLKAAKRLARRSGPVQKVRTDDGNLVEHQEPPSAVWRPLKLTADGLSSAVEEHNFTNDRYNGKVTKYTAGFPLGGGPWAVIRIANNDGSARHDWRDFQKIKSQLVGDEWEAVELYPAESRLRDPSNYFMLWCVPKGVFAFGLPAGRAVCNPGDTVAPQRPFPKEEERRIRQENAGREMVDQVGNILAPTRPI